MTGTDSGLSATIQEADLDADRAALGYQVADRAQEFLSVATPEAIRNFAHSYGDDNPLFCDPGYGVGARWGGQIAPSLMAGILNAPLLGDPVPDDRRGGRYRGIHVFASAFAWDFFRPLRPGDTVYSFSCLESSEVRETKFAGRSVFRTTRWVKMNQDAEVLSVHRMLGIYNERSRSKARSKAAAPVELARYGDDELAALDAIYAAESRSGPTPRWWDDVEIDDPLPQKAKGPFTVTDIIRFHAGGYHLNDLLTGRMAWENRVKKPRFYTPNDQGIPDVVQRVHWDAPWAQAIGRPTSIDYGSMREFWIHHALTDWIGDAGWVASQRVELRKFSYLGDAHVLGGRVVDKRRTGAGGEVDLEIHADNQRGETTAIATATVLLPMRDAPAPGLPHVPDELAADAERMMAVHRDLTGAPRGSGPA